MNVLLFAITAVAFLVMWTILLRPRADRRCEHCSRPLELWPEEHHGHRVLVCQHCRKAWGWGESLRPALASCPRCNNQSLQITGLPDPEDEQAIHVTEVCHLCEYRHEGTLHLRSAKAAREDGNVIFFPGADDPTVEEEPSVPVAPTDEGEAIPFPGPTEGDDATGEPPGPGEANGQDEGEPHGPRPGKPNQPDDKGPPRPDGPLDPDEPEQD